MKILVIGAGGLIGQAVADNLAEDHEVLRVSRSSGDIRADVTDPASVKALFDGLSDLDAIITTTGRQAYGAITELASEDFALGLNDKVLGQINVVLAGQKALRDGGSFTLTSGIMPETPFPGGICAFADNAAIESFARAAAAELPRDLRINVVSPAIVIKSSSEPYPADQVPPGLAQIPAADVALSYRHSIEDWRTAQTYRVWG